MRFITVTLAASLMALLCDTPSANAQSTKPIAETATESTPPSNRTSLFNGTNLDGWFGLGHFDPRKLAEMSEEERTEKRKADLQDVREHWSVEDGQIVNDGHGVFLTTEESFGDIELWVDYKTVALADSGIYLRGSPQVQIWDFTEAGGKWDIGADKGSGGLWNNKAPAGKDPTVLADNPFGEWNSFRIVQVGARTSVWLNDKHVVDHATMENFWDRKRPLFREGFIQLQTHGGEIRWRNIYVRKIEAAEANAILASNDAEGFQAMFNGKDFSGWSGATDEYEIKDGAIVCKSGSGGTIFTEEEYEDFVARFEFKLPPGGNNGIAIRYPGEGDGAYMGMCELQVLDSEHDKFKSLDPRQYHGSAYGMVAAHRGYLRPTGEWNFQEITVRGTTVRVELNGSIILDTDLAEVTEFLGEQPHPGLKNKSGHFGFAGHNDPVEFRNVQIKRLEK